jgi:peroxiredoxin
MVMSLTAELDVLREGAISRMPSEALGAIKHSIEDLSRSGIGARSLKVGDFVPDFELPNAVGKRVRLKTLLKDGPVVATFYRGGWCPFCSAELQAYENVFEEIKKLGATVVAISPQTPDNSLTTAEKQNLTFEVLSDVFNDVARQFGIVYHVQDELQALYEDLGLDLPALNGDSSFDLPVPATYVIDQVGMVRMAFVDPDYTRRLDPAEVLSVLRSLRRST